MSKFQMILKGNKKDIERFYNSLTLNSPVYIGRGACARIEYIGPQKARIEGYCKKSVRDSLYVSALMMQVQKETGKGRYEQGFIDAADEIVTVFEAVKRYDLVADFYTEEDEGSVRYYIANGNVVRMTNTMSDQMRMAVAM